MLPINIFFFIYNFFYTYKEFTWHLLGINPVRTLRAPFAIILACSCAFPYSCLISSSNTRALITAQASLNSGPDALSRINIFLSLLKISALKIFCLLFSCFMQHSLIHRKRHCNVGMSG